jgi:ABC-type transporter Mla subunit MlaD
MRACAENLSALYGQVRHAAQTLNAQATEIHELTQRLESLTKDTPACMPARGPKWR